MSNNKFQICGKCKHTNVKTLKPKLQKLAPDAEIKVGCKSYCGPCSKSAFIFVNGRYVTGTTEDEAVEKVKKFIK